MEHNSSAANVLLVDDHPENLVALEAVLGGMGLNLVLASCGKDALRAVLKSDFALILLDVRMPEIDGIETARLIRERERSRNTPIIFMTAYAAGDEQVFEGYASGAVDYISKPFNTQVLRSKVSVFVELYRKTNELQRINETLEEKVQERTRELQLAEAKFRSIFENSMHGIYQSDANHHYTTVNPALARILGYSSPAQLVSEVTNIGQQVYADEEQYQEFLRLTCEQGAVTGFETQVFRRDGQGIWVSESARAILDEEGRVIGHEGVVEDITKRKRAEAEIAAKNRDLEALLYVTSHDLREPLRAIAGYSSIIHDRYASTLDKEANDYLARVIAAAKRLDILLDNIQTLIKAQRMEPPSQDVSCHELVKEALALLEAKIEQTKATVTVAPDLPRLRVDPTWAKQAIYNLIINALKFTKDGAPPEVEILAYCPPGENCRATGIIVRDRGPGVSPRNARKVFELFKREVGREVEGTGSGLAIVKQVAIRHNGEAWVQPRDGGGSEFIITFGPPQPRKINTPTAQPNGASTGVPERSAAFTA